MWIGTLFDCLRYKYQKDDVVPTDTTHRICYNQDSPSDALKRKEHFNNVRRLERQKNLKEMG